METVELAYEELGVGNPVPLIILHGFFASSRNWRKIAERLSAIFHVYVLDLRNHGLSPHHAIMDYPSMAADVLQFMDKHQLATAHLLGHSMGGKIAMWLALIHPYRLEKLIVADIAPKSYVHSFDNTIQALIDLPLSEIHSRKQAEILLSSSLPDLSYRQFLLQNLVLKDNHYCWRVDLAVFKQTAANIISFPDTQDLLPYKGGTIFIAGAESSYLAPQDRLNLFPDSEFKMVAGAGHWLHVQQPAIFIELVENFLQNGS